MIAWPSWFSSDFDRSAQAQKTLGKLNQTNWITGVIHKSKVVAQSLVDASPGELVAHTQRLRRLVRSGTDLQNSELLTLAAGGVIEAVRRALQLTLFDVQIHAGIVVSCCAVAEMQTGEGKTLSGILPAYIHALGGKGVHVATTNTYLASRDHEELTPVFQLLGMTTGLLEDDATDEQTQLAYQADVTYGPGHAFGFDFLRDQMLMSQAESRPLGANVFDQSRENDPKSKLRQRPLSAAIVDEIDHVLLDDAGSPLILSTSSEGEAVDARIHVLACDAVTKLHVDQHFLVQHDKRIVQLTSEGFDYVYQDSAMALNENLMRPWHDYIVLALRAKWLFHRDVDYVVTGDEVQIVDQSTGRVFADRTWSEGLHQAVLAAEGLPITPETSSLAKITRQRFYRHYKSLGGMTGTATGCEQEFASVYGIPVSVVPLRQESKRKVMPANVTLSQHEKFDAIAGDVSQLIQQDRAVLIGTLNIAQSVSIAERLKERGLKFELLNGIQDADEAAIVARAGRRGAITVATNLAGRGTDIKLDPQVRAAGGLHVIAVEHHSLSRVDRQLIGRCARCGDPGSARFYVAADDELFRNHAMWISRAINRNHAKSNTIALDSPISRAQKKCQTRASSGRWQMLEQDRELESLLDQDQQLDGCWQL